MEILNFIRGQFRPTAKTLSVINPATEQVIASLPDSDQKDVEDAVEAASKAFQSWSRTTPQERSVLLNKIADAIEERLEEFALAESRDQGKPVSLARTVDIPRAIYNFRFFANSILYSTESSRESNGCLNYVQRTPAGVAALISPWNLPLYLLTWKIAPCLAFGCTCVCKPSEMTSITAFMLCEILEKILPPGVVNMCFGTGPSAGSVMVSHPKVPLVSFTGGTVTGQKIYEMAAPLNKKLSLELGGKNANILFDDCDLEAAVTTSIRSSFANQGEICLCGSRIFVQQGIYERFISNFCEKTRNLVVGDPLDPATNVGALVSEDHMKKVLGYVNIAKEQGAKVLVGGYRLERPGYFVAPTVIVDCHPTNCRIQKEEVFGPVVTVVPFKTEEEVVEYANATDYGLACSVWTRDVSRAHRVAKEIHVGTCWVNCWMVRDLNMPFGGVKGSGLGREGRLHSQEFFCEEKTICIKL